ncbi:MAG TPA: flagellin [Syntrophomonadaceae bacterium]|nr:flagellin [Syntrophomonadaceae bacterium]
MIINHNITALNTLNSLNKNENATSKSLEKLSSGYRINNASDDAAGLSISEKMRGQIRGLDQAKTNAQTGISLLQTAEGALSETTSILQRVRELAVQSASDTATDSDRTSCQQEASQLLDEVDNIANTTQFNTKNLLDGTLAEGSATSLGTKLNSFSLKTSATQGTSVGNTAVSSPVTITSGTNDQINLNVDGGGAQQITIAAGTYNSASDLAAAVNTAIGNNSSLSGKVTAEVTSSGHIQFISASTGTSSSVAVTAGTNNASGSLGFTTASQTAGTAASSSATGSTTLVSLADKDGNNLGLKSGNRINISVMVGGQEKTTSLDVTSTTTLQNLTDQIHTAIGGASSVTIGSDNQIHITGQAGTANEVSNVTLSVQNSATDTEKTDVKFGNYMSAYTETQAATDMKTDSSVKFQIGANQNQTMSINISKMDRQALALSSVNLSTQAGAEAAITVVDNAVNNVSSERSKLGAYENRLSNTIDNLTTASQNITSAESKIRDVDMAAEMTNYQKNYVLQQAAQAMLAQANQQPQQVLSLLK